MELYILLFPTFLNTILLIVMAVVLYRLLVIAGDLSVKMSKFAERSEEEMFATSSAIRHAANQAGNLLEKIVEVVDKYAFAHALRQQPPRGGSGGKTPSIITGINIGITIFRFLSQFFKKEKQAETQEGQQSQ